MSNMIDVTVKAEPFRALTANKQVEGGTVQQIIDSLNLPDSVSAKVLVDDTPVAPEWWALVRRCRTRTGLRDYPTRRIKAPCGGVLRADYDRGQ